MGPPLVAATIAAVIAFLTVKISKVPMVQDFGVLLSIGIVALLVAGVVVPTTIIGARERRSPTTKEPVESWVEKTVDRLGSLPRVAVLPLVIIAIALPVLGLLLESGSKIESDPINWANQSSTSIKNARTLEKETGFATTLGVFVKTDSAAADERLHRSDGRVRVRPRRAVDDREQGARRSIEPGDDGRLAGRGAEHDLVATHRSRHAAGLQHRPACAARSAGRQRRQRHPGAVPGRAVIARRARPGARQGASRHRRSRDDGGLLPAKASATTGGLAVVGVGLLENITANRAQLTIAALLLVGAFVILRYRDLARGLLTMVPVLIAVGTSAVLVRVLNITLSPLSTVGGPLVVATCAEFSVLLIARYAEERERGLDPELSTHMAAKHTGRAFFTSALTTLGGFAVLMFSSLPLLADFGMVVTINIGVALLSALVVVPPLVKEADRRGLLAMGPERAHAHTGPTRRSRLDRRCGDRRARHRAGRRLREGREARGGGQPADAHRRSTCDDPTDDHDHSAEHHDCTAARCHPRARRDPAGRHTATRPSGAPDRARRRRVLRHPRRCRRGSRMLPGVRQTT